MAAVPGMPSDRARSVALWGTLALFLPLAFVGLVLSANEYRAWGGSGVDCDGPMLLGAAVPAAVVYTLGALVLARRAHGRRSWGAGLAAVLCVAIVALLGLNIRSALRELNDPAHREVCNR